MSPRELEQGVAWFADQFYSLPSIFDRLLFASRASVSGGTSPAILATTWRSFGARPSISRRESGGDLSAFLPPQSDFVRRGAFCHDR